MVRRLRGEVTLDTTDAEESADRLTSKLGSGGGGGGGLSGLGLAGAATGAAAGIAALTRSVIEDQVELRQLSEISGLGTEELQRWGQAARDGGGSAEDAADAARELQLRLAEASSLGTGPAVDALDLLNLSLDDLINLPVSEQLARVRDALSAVEDESQRLFLAEELLGGSAERLNTALAENAEAFNNQRVVLEENTFGDS